MGTPFNINPKLQKMRRKFSYTSQLFLLIWGLTILLVVSFIYFQYSREKHFKAESLNAQLQILNTQIIDKLDARNVVQYSTAIDSLMVLHHKQFPNLRVTLIRTNGNVLYDSHADSVMSNHLNRPEVQEALKRGTGYTIRRSSETMHEDFFYTATRSSKLEEKFTPNDLIVRTALPYHVSLEKTLKADTLFIWLVFAVSFAIMIVGYFATRRLRLNMVRLKEFAQRADNGLPLDGLKPFKDDELGGISSHIVGLYARLQKIAEERDKEHDSALYEEQEKIRIKRQLTNNINHELKTPVSVIQGYLEILNANPDLASETRNNFIEKSLMQSKRLSSLLSDISLITRLDEGSTLILCEEVMLNGIIEELRSEMALQPEEKRMRIHCNFKMPIVVEGNASLIYSIFHNLMSNAIAYSGGKEIFINLLEEDESSYSFTFSDNGVGVSPEHLPHLFERFYRVDKGRSRKQGGTGLGLSIVKNAVRFHGGNIEARLRKDGGLKFAFSLQKKHQQINTSNTK